VWCPVLADTKWLADKWDSATSQQHAERPTWQTLEAGETQTVPTENDACDMRMTQERTPVDVLKVVFADLNKVRCPYDNDKRLALGHTLVNVCKSAGDAWSVYLRLADVLEANPGREWQTFDRWLVDAKSDTVDAKSDTVDAESDTWSTQNPTE
jgi:hypothetical protein